MAAYNGQKSMKLKIWWF